jgi:hypothetical protein
MLNGAGFQKNTLHILAWLFAFALSFIVFVLFLQTPVISLSRLLVAAFVFVISAIFSLWVLAGWLLPRLEEKKNSQAIALSAFILPALFLPQYFTTPSFPKSPLLREQTDVAMQFKLSDSSKPLDFPSEDIRLVIGKDVFDLRAFKAESGAELADRFTLPAGGSEFFRWQGSVDSLITLNLTIPPAEGTLTVYWDRNRTVYQLNSTTATVIVMRRKFETSVALTVLLFLSEYAILVFAILILGVLLSTTLAQVDMGLQNKKWNYLLIIGAILLSAIMIKLQVDGIVGGIATLNTEQLERHVDVLRGTAPDPWQYRVLSEWIAEVFVRVFGFLPRPEAVVFGFLSLRMLQNVATFALAYLLYKRLGGSFLLGMLGIVLLASSMKNALFESDLSFNTYFDLLFYLMAVVFILDDMYLWIIPLMFFAALNRETSGLIPFLLLYSALIDRGSDRSRKITVAIVTFAIWVLIFFGLRLLCPDRPIFIPYDHAPGYPLLIYNLTRSVTWTELFHALGVIPFAGLLVFFAWHSDWKGYFFIMVPAWLLIHSFASVMAETRLFLVPQAIVFIPGVIFLLSHLKDGPRPESAPN